MIDVRFKLLDENAKLPCYKHDGDSGMDVASVENVQILPHSFALIRTGLAPVIPEGFEIQVRPRSGLQCKNGIVGAFGTVDEGYRGEIKVALYNHNDIPYIVRIGDRIAQFVISPVVRARISETKDIGPSTDRGDRGFGSTGV